jgi:hypothetical protein
MLLSYCILMDETSMKPFHFALPEQTHDQLTAEAERVQVSATILARETVDQSQQRMRASRHAEISTYAAEMARSGFDLDSDLESARIEHLMKIAKVPK